MLGAAAFVGYSLLRKGKALGNLFYYPKSVKDIRLDGITPVITFGLAIDNTSNQSFTLHSMAGEIYANGNYVGHVGTFNQQVIYPNQETIIYIEARMALLGIVNDIITGIKNKTFTQSLKLSSYANIDNLQVPIIVTYTFK